MKLVTSVEFTVKLVQIEEFDDSPKLRKKIEKLKETLSVDFEKAMKELFEDEVLSGSEGESCLVSVTRSNLEVQE